MSAHVPRLHVIGPLGNVSDPDEYLRVVRELAGLDNLAIHVRLPGARGGDVLNLVRELLGADARVMVNDRVDVTMVAGVAGVHLGERSLPVDITRQLVGPDRLVGRSVHSTGGAEEAARTGADFVIAGHVFETASKAGQPGRGLQWLANICRHSQVPVIAIGGITIERVDDVIAAGAWGAAVGREILEADNPRAVAETLLANMEESETISCKVPKRRSQ